MIQLTFHSRRGSITLRKHLDRRYMRSLDHDNTTHHRTSSQHGGNQPATHRTEQIRKAIYASKSPCPCPCPNIYALAIPETTGTSKTSIDQSTSRLDPSSSPPPRSAGSQLQEQKHITHHKPGHISRACPLTQFTHPPKATTQLPDVLNRTKHVPNQRGHQSSVVSLLGLLVRRSDMLQPAGPTKPRASEPKAPLIFACKSG